MASVVKVSPSKDQAKFLHMEIHCRLAAAVHLLPPKEVKEFS